MGEEIEEFEDEISKMLLGRKEAVSLDEELALYIMHLFNIDRETVETMPAFEEHLKLLFSPEKEK